MQPISILLRPTLKGSILLTRLKTIGMKKKKNADDVDVHDLMIHEHSSERTAEREIKAMKLMAGKTKNQPCTFEDYCAYRGYTRAQGLRALDRAAD